jgi:hypothetical protein
VDLTTGRPPRRETTTKPRRPASNAKPADAGPSLFAPPGNWSSPIVDVQEVRGRGSDAVDEVNLPGIELDVESHHQTWKTWEPHVRKWTENEGAGTRRYHPDNGMFGIGSARLLAGAIGAIHPRRYVEIGSGFSSAVLLDINEEWRADDPIELTFIEPYPGRLRSILRARDESACTILEEKVQDVDLEVFAQLQPGDVLFVDSSHVAKTGSDLLRELFEVLPLLPVGTFVHFHDIFYPFDYPAAWLIDQNRSWNEAYFLRAFLMYNAQFKVHFWSDYLGLFSRDQAHGDQAPSLLPTRSSSIWLERVAP